MIIPEMKPGTPLFNLNVMQLGYYNYGKTVGHREATDEKPRGIEFFTYGHSAEFIRIFNEGFNAGYILGRLGVPLSND